MNSLSECIRWISRRASYQIVRRNVETAWDAVGKDPKKFIEKMSPIIDRWEKDPPDITTINDFKKALKEVTREVSLNRPSGTSRHVYELQID